MPKFESPRPTSAEAGKISDDELAAYFESQQSPFDNRDAEPGIAVLVELFTSYEATHDLDALNAIDELTPEEASRHPVREPARIGLNAIVAQLNSIDTQTNIGDEQWNALCERYAHLSRAVGIINKNRVDHTRMQSFGRTPRSQ
jgi:hypothetical protein